MNHQRTISVKYMLLSLLLCWRSILVFAILFSMLFGLYGYMQSDKAKVDMKAGGVDNATLDMYLTEIVTWNENIRIKQERLDSFLLYKENGITEVNSGVVACYLTVGEVDNTTLTRLNNKYFNLMTSDELYRNIADSLNVGNIAYINEMIVPTDQNDLLVYATISSPDSDTTMIIARNIEDIWNKYYPQYKSDICEHSINVEIYEPHTNYSTYYSDNRGYTSQNIVDLQNYINNRMQDLSDEQQAYINEVIAGERERGDYPWENASTEKHFNKMYVMLGAIFGIVLALLIGIMRYCLSKKLHTSEELENSFNKKVLVNKKASLYKNPIDRAFQNIIEKTIKNSFDEKKLIDLISGEISANRLGQDSYKIMISAVTPNEAMKGLAETLISSNSDVEFTFVDDLLYNAESVIKMKDMDGLIVLAQLESSNMDDVTRQARLLKDSNVICCIA